MACKPITFKGISRVQFKAIRARVYAQADKTSTASDDGSVEGQGIAAQYSYSEALQTLTVTVTSKPFFVSEGLIADKLQALVESVG